MFTDMLTSVMLLVVLFVTPGGEEGRPPVVPPPPTARNEEREEREEEDREEEGEQPENDENRPPSRSTENRLVGHVGHVENRQPGTSRSPVANGSGTRSLFRRRRVRHSVMAPLPYAPPSSPPAAQSTIERTYANMTDVESAWSSTRAYRDMRARRERELLLSRPFYSTTVRNVDRLLTRPSRPERKAERVVYRQGMVGDQCKVCYEPVLGVPLANCPGVFGVEHVMCETCARRWARARGGELVCAFCRKELDF